MRSQEFENKNLTKMCSGSEAGSYLRFIGFVYHSTLGLRVIEGEKGQELANVEFLLIHDSPAKRLLPGSESPKKDPCVLTN